MVPPVPHDSSLELAQRLDAVAALATVSDVRRLNDSIVEIALSHDSVEQLAGTVGNDVMVRLESEPGLFVRRRYSVRSLDVANRELRLWISVIHEGVGSAWAARVNVGDEVDVVGPRGKISLDPLADWHLFVGDTSALGAFYRMAEAVEEPGRVVFVVELEGADQIVTPLLPEGLGVTGIFVERQGRDYGDPSGLLSALAAFSFPEDEGHAYVFGEFAVSRVVRTALLDRGLEEGQIDLKAFWRAGRRNAEHGEPPKD